MAFPGPGKPFVLTLTPAVNGQFTVGGTYGEKATFSGTLRKDKNGEYQMRAKLRAPGSGNEGGPVDGYWSTDSNTLVITNVNGDHTPMYGTLLKKPQVRA